MSRVNKYRVWCKHSWIEDLEEKAEYFMEYNIREVKIEDTPNYPQGRLIGKKGLWCAIHESVFMQYIGVDDKNGKEIYEGDIVQVEYTDGQEDYLETVEVSWDKESAGFSPWNWQYQCDGCDLYCEIQSAEVIGNVYENADLLKEAGNE